MSGAHVFIDRSQFPENVRRDLLDSLRARAINHKFHYDSYKQAAKWLALHEAYSPARRDPDCQRIYDDAFDAVVAANLPSMHVVALGCGGGQKEARLLQLLRDRNIETTYTASDVSLALVLEARAAALSLLSAERCESIVCDLGTTTELPAALDSINQAAPRIVTLFGILPNFEPTPLLARIAPLLRPQDWLLLSANLAPGDNYSAGVRAVLPQYDNALTRDWLLTFLRDLGFEDDDGELNFAIETDSSQWQRLCAHFELKRPRAVRVFGETIAFPAGERIRLFFSYRHTPQSIQTLINEQQMEVCGIWSNHTREEGVFLCRRS